MRPLNQICLIIVGGGGGYTITSVLKALNKEELNNLKFFRNKVGADRAHLISYAGTESAGLQKLLAKGKSVDLDEASKLLR